MDATGTQRARSTAGPFRRHVALPADHGAWVLVIAPLAIGLLAGGRWTAAGAYLIVAVLAGFLVRHPLELAVRAYAGRRPRGVLPTAGFWAAVYGAIALLSAAGLVLRGFGHLLWLALVAVPVFAWHLYLVARRRERRQWPVETLAAGALALAAPAGHWVGVGRPEPAGWLLWILCWGQSSSWIAHAYLRLGQRERARSRAEPAVAPPPGWSSLATAGGTLAVALGAGLAGAAPRWLWIAFSVQCAESLWGTLAPAPDAKPRAIGFRQLLLSVVQTALFALLWRAA